LIVFWGYPSGVSSRPVAYSSDSVSSFNQGGGEHNIEVGDINKDGWGDIIAGADNSSQNIHLYYWGENRTPKNVVDLPGAGGSNHGVSMADFNNDGWLDLVFTLSYGGGGKKAIIYFYDPETGTYPPASAITVTPGSCYGGSAVWDWGDKKGGSQQDGLLDIIFFRADPNDPQPPVVYYNQGEEPYFWDSDTTTKNIGNANIVSSGGFVADFNYDGHLDIYLNAYRGHHSSYILYGPNYLMADADSVPVNEDHHGVFREPGNIYNREYTAWYDSDVHDCGKFYNKAKNCKVTYIANEPRASKVDFYLRSGPDSLPSSRWTKWDKVENGYGDPNALRWRYVQYRAEFRYPRPADLPWLERVSFLFYLIDFDLKLWPDSLKSNPAGDSSDYLVKLFYMGDERDSFHINVRPTLKEGWKVQLWDTAYIDTIPWYIKLDAIQPNGDDTAFYARITAPENAQVGDSNVTILWTKTTHCSQAMADSVILITKVVEKGGVTETHIYRPTSANMEVVSLGNDSKISYNLPANDNGNLIVYDASGRRVFEESVSGSGSVIWNDNSNSSGLYFIHLKHSNGIIRKKALLLK